VSGVVLIHGALHGAWCWDEVAAGLRVRGVEVMVPEHPCDHSPWLTRPGDIADLLAEHATA
jgi:hypothetical protein